MPDFVEFECNSYYTFAPSLFQINLWTVFVSVNLQTWHIFYIIGTQVHIYNVVIWVPINVNGSLLVKDKGKILLSKCFFRNQKNAPAAVNF